MTPTQLSALLVELLSLPAETEWVEWKHNNDKPDMIAQRISAVANSAALHGRDFGYMIWGVEDDTKKLVGTTFRPRQSKKGNEELENWLMRSQHPQVSFQFFEWSHQGLPMVLFQIPRAS
jgi:predicted HTH transcriptional regulator